MINTFSVGGLVVRVQMTQHPSSSHLLISPQQTSLPVSWGLWAQWPSLAQLWPWPPPQQAGIYLSSASLAGRGAEHGHHHRCQSAQQQVRSQVTAQDFGEPVRGQASRHQAPSYFHSESLFRQNVVVLEWSLVFLRVIFLQFDECQT